LGKDGVLVDDFDIKSSCTQKRTWVHTSKEAAGEVWGKNTQKCTLQGLFFGLDKNRTFGGSLDKNGPFWQNFFLEKGSKPSK
jgi:hypothetical protein